MLKKKNNSGKKGKTSAFDALKPSTSQKRKLESAVEEDPLAITEADLRTFETPPKKRKTATAEPANWSSKVIFKHGKVQLIEDSPGDSKGSGKKGKKSEPTVKFTTVAAKKYIPGTPVQVPATKTNTTPKSILKKTSNKKTSPQKSSPVAIGRERRQAAPTYLREDTPSPVRGSKRQFTSAYSPNSNKKTNNKAKPLSKYKSESKSKQPSIVLNTSICEAANPKVLLTNYKPSRKSQPSVVLTSCKKNSKEPRKKDKISKPLTSTAKAKGTNAKSNATKSAKAKKSSSKPSVNLNMLLKRNKRRIKPARKSPSPPPVKKLKTNTNNNFKKTNTKQNTAGPKSMKKKMTQEDVARLLKKYKKLLPAVPPVVKLKQLTFKASHHTGEPYRLPSDVNLIRDSAAFYDILGIIVQNLDVSDKYKALAVCKLWNRAGKEETAWKRMIFINRHLLSLKPLERLILKHETESLQLENVSVSVDANQYDFCRFSSVRDITCSQTDPILLENVLRACNDLEHIKILDENVDILREANSSAIKTILAPIATVYTTANLFKRFNDLEKLVLHTFDPESYKQMGLLLSLKELVLTHLYITQDIENFIENIPNIEYMSFNPIYCTENIYESEINRQLVEGLKRCPSLKKLVWVTYEEVVIVEKQEPEKKPEIEELVLIDADQSENKKGIPLSPAADKDSSSPTKTVENDSEPMDTNVLPNSEITPEIVSDDLPVSPKKTEISTEGTLACTTEEQSKLDEPLDTALEYIDSPEEPIPVSENPVNESKPDEPLDTGLEPIDSPEETPYFSSEEQTSHPVKLQENTVPQDVAAHNKTSSSVEPMETDVEYGEKVPRESTETDAPKQVDNNDARSDEPMDANEAVQKQDETALNVKSIKHQNGNISKNSDDKDHLENGMDECTDEIKAIKEENIQSDNEEEEKEEMLDNKLKFTVDSLKKIAFKLYLTSSLSECDIGFKIIKKFRYVKQSE